MWVQRDTDVKVLCPGLPQAPLGGWAGQAWFVSPPSFHVNEHPGTTSQGPAHWALLPAVQAVDGEGSSAPCSLHPLPPAPGLSVPLVLSGSAPAHCGLEGEARSPPYSACETKASHVCISFSATKQNF